MVTATCVTAERASSAQPPKYAMPLKAELFEFGTSILSFIGSDEVQFATVKFEEAVYT